LENVKNGIDLDTQGAEDIKRKPRFNTKRVIRGRIS
jgi:hypothetical protein